MSANAITVLAIFGPFAVIIALGFLGGLLYEMHMNNKRLIKLNTISVMNSVDFDVKSILLDIIEECFQDYQVMHLIPLQEIHISDEREREIRSDLVTLVSERISDSAVAKLTIRYKEAAIASVIADKIYITVMNYVRAVNSTKYN